MDSSHLPGVFTVPINQIITPGQIDIEGYEFREGGFQDWISTGALEIVSQIALELHINDSPGDERLEINILGFGWLKNIYFNFIFLDNTLIC